MRKAIIGTVLLVLFSAVVSIPSVVICSDAYAGGFVTESCSEVAAKIFRNGSLSAKSAFLKQYQGKQVRWSGKLVRIDQTLWGVQAEVRCSAGSGRAEATISFDKSANSEILNYRKGQKLNFSGQFEGCSEDDGMIVRNAQIWTSSVTAPERNGPAMISAPATSPSLSQARKNTGNLQLVYSGQWADFFVGGGDIEKNAESYAWSGCFTVELHSVYKGKARTSMIENVKKMLGAGEMKASPEGGDPDFLKDVVTATTYDTRNRIVTLSGEQSYSDINNKIIGITNVQQTYPLDSQKYVTLNNIGSSIESLLKTAASSGKSTIPQPNISVQSVNINYQSNATPLVIAMINSARNEEKLIEAENGLNSLPKPHRGNKVIARAQNKDALALMKQSKDIMAVPLLESAHQADPSDVEITNNLASAYFNTSFSNNDFTKTKAMLVETLRLRPDRAIAWSNFGRVFAMEGNEYAATNCYINFYRFSKNHDNALEDLVRDESDPQPILSQAVKAAYEYITNSVRNDQDVK